MKNTVIYGASGGGKKVPETLKNMNIDVDFFVDGNDEKWGTVFEGKEVKSPEEIDKELHQIIIASELNQEAIEKRLDKLGLLQNVIMKEEIMLPYMENIKKRINVNSNIPRNDKRKVFIELLEGPVNGCGGIVSWSMNVARMLRKNGIEAGIMSSARYTFHEGQEELFIPFETSYDNYWEDVINLVNYFSKNLPCTLILNKQMQMLYAGILLKEMFPDDVKIISVIHNDAICLYKRSVLTKEYIDKYLAITNPISESLQNIGVSEKHILFHDMPIIDKFFVNHLYSLDESPINVAYAGRVEAQTKRADLLVKLIEALENRKIQYRFHIAGSGSYEDNIKEFVDKNNLQDKVKMYGYISRDDVPDFWKDKDVCVVPSDKEGCCLSMMEAMAAGCVPVTTSFSNAKAFITQEKNGYVCDFEDVNSMADIIQNLYKERYMVKQLGERASEYIKLHCSQKDYEQFLVTMVSDD